MQRTMTGAAQDIAAHSTPQQQQLLGRRLARRLGKLQHKLTSSAVEVHFLQGQIYKHVCFRMIIKQYCPNYVN